MKNLGKTFFVGLLSLLVAFSIVASAFAKGQSAPAGQDAFPTVEPTPTRVPGLVVANPNIISFTQLRTTEIQLVGPQDAATLVFGLPADWKFNADGTLQLDLGVSFNTFAGAAVGQGTAGSVGGTLTILFNRRAVGSFPLNQNGEIQEIVTIPLSALTPVRSDGRMEISFVLDSGLSCYINQQMNVFIHLSSNLLIPHEVTLPDTNLARFPFPLFQRTFFPESALIVIPDQPSASDLQAALTLSAGLTNLTGNDLALDLTNVSELTLEQKAATHLILVGLSSNLPLANLGLPLAPAADASLPLENLDDGVVQMVNSPWNPAKVVMVVTGNSETGVIKAARATTTGFLRPNAAPNLAIIQDVQPDPVPVSVPIDQTLADLGYGNDSFNSTSAFFDTNIVSYRFYIPPGQITTDQAYFELIFGHSALLNYDRSGVVVLLNSQPIGSIRFNDTYAAQSMNPVKINIPASATLPGYNRLDVRVDLVPNDICVTTNLDALYFTIWPESSLHLPLGPVVISPIAALDLSAYPAPFVFDPTLENTAFVLQRDNADAWRGALKIAGLMGERANGSLTNLSVFFADEATPEQLTDYNVLLVGRPSQMPLFGQFNEQLPAPFDLGTDTATERNVQVTFRIPENASLGYIQMMTSPWNAERILMLAAGNNSTGITQASAALVDSALRSRLAGNFAVISGTQILTADTRLAPVNPDTILTPAAVDVVAVPGKIDLTPPAVERPAWIAPVIIGVLVLIVIILLIVVISSARRNQAPRA